jgi:hypothetical protein
MTIRCRFRPETVTVGSVGTLSRIGVVVAYVALGLLMSALLVTTLVSLAEAI